MRLRRAKDTKDLRAIARMDMAIFGDQAPIVDWSEAVWFIGHDNGKPVCYSAIQILGDGIAYLSRAGVVKSHRGRGYQRRMINKRLDYARWMRCKKVITYASPDNYASMNSLAACGFKFYCPESPWVGSYFMYFMREI